MQCISTITKKEIGPYDICPECVVIYKRCPHMEIQTPESILKMFCTQCNILFSNSTNYYIEKGVRMTVICDHCEAISLFNGATAEDFDD